MHRFVVLLFLFVNTTTKAQKDDYSGSYTFYVKTIKGEIINYKLVLNTDHTFMFTSYINNNTNAYQKNGKGTWSEENNRVLFTTKSTDIDSEHILNFSGSTARLIKKSPRNTSEKVFPTALQFYQSEIPWIAHLKLFLNE